MVSGSVGVAMSGGIDSTVAAALLLQQGWQVHGFFMDLGLGGTDRQFTRLVNRCRALAIPLHRLDLRQPFREQVIKPFLAIYLSGSTPNPCVLCNHRVKFRLLVRAMLESGMEYAVTGHYARIQLDNTGQPHLLRGVDPVKDQSYFLCRLLPAQLERVLLPLGEYRKEQIYQLAEEFKLGTFPEGESQDVCFLGAQPLASFFAAEGIVSRPGPIVSAEGEVLGEHQGIWHYTIGQRRGLNLPDHSPWFVRGLDPKGNRVIVGKQDTLYQHTLLLREVQWLQAQESGWEGLIQLRSRQVPVDCTIRREGERLRVEMHSPQRAVTPGQFGALYGGEELLGSGVIENPPLTTGKDT